MSRRTRKVRTPNASQTTLSWPTNSHNARRWGRKQGRRLGRKALPAEGADCTPVGDAITAWFSSASAQAAAVYRSAEQGYAAALLAAAAAQAAPRTEVPARPTGVGAAARAADAAAAAVAADNSARAATVAAGSAAADQLLAEWAHHCTVQRTIAALADELLAEVEAGVLKTHPDREVLSQRRWRHPRFTPATEMLQIRADLITALQQLSLPLPMIPWK